MHVALYRTSFQEVALRPARHKRAVPQGGGLRARFLAALAVSAGAARAAGGPCATAPSGRSAWAGSGLKSVPNALAAAAPAKAEVRAEEGAELSMSRERG